MLTGSLRRDASSNFSKANRVGYFPAFAAAWKIKDQFFQDRAIYLVSLNFGLAMVLQVSRMVSGTTLTYPVTRTAILLLPTSSATHFIATCVLKVMILIIKWETTTTSNVGLDFGFLKNRLSGSVDYYFKKTKDLFSTYR